MTIRCGERFGADVRQLLQRLLAPPRRAAHALSEADERIEDDGRPREADEREPGVVMHEDPVKNTSDNVSRARSPMVSETAR